MIVIRKYDKNGKSERISFGRKIAALLWLCDHIDEAEWCCIMYEKESEINA